MKKKFWTDERIAMLRRLAPRMSAGMIADEIGCTREAVIGKAYREGISLETLPGERRQHMSRHRKTDASRPNLQRAERIVRTAEDIKRNMSTLQSPPQPFKTWDGFVSLFDLMDHHCRSIEHYDGPIAFFCGRPKYRGTSWCEKHARRYCPGLFRDEPQHLHQQG